MEKYPDRRLLPRFNRRGVSHWIRGVFEGGGVKGIAYRGALEQVDTLNCWFEAVAGASAGAITAALIAAGYAPKDLDQPMDELLDIMRIKGVWRAAKSLRKEGQVYPRTEFRDTLDGFLRRKIDDLGLPLEDGEPLSFKTLYRLTGIELYVCAADITNREPIVFSHEFTPDCQVADAVVASSSIPFAFDGGMLTSNQLFQSGRTPKGTEVSVRGFRTVVDGGVWTNFPMFVFKDRTFNTYMREALGLKPRDADADEAVESGQVVGFLLHELIGDEREGDEEKRKAGLAKAYKQGVSFIDGPENNEKLVPIERAKEMAQPIQKAKTRMGRLISRLLDLWRRLAKLESSLPHGTNIRRYQAPRQESPRIAVDMLDNALGVLHSSAGTLISVSIFLIIQLIVLVLWASFLGDSIFVGWSDLIGGSGGYWDFFGPIAGAISIFLIYLLQFAVFGFIFVGPIILNWAFLIPIRRILVGLIGTLVATPGSAPWEHRDPEVIALPIPSKLTTLSQKRDIDDCREQVLEWARAETAKRLPEILRRI